MTTNFQPYRAIRSYYRQRLLHRALFVPVTEPRLLASSTALHPAPVALDGDICVATMAEARRVMGGFSRRDHFKVVLVLEGANELHYATRSYAIDRPALVFTNRLVPYAWEVVEGSGEQQGYICGFTEDFLHSAMRGVSLKETVLYKVDGNPVYFLTQAQQHYLTEVFGRMRRDMDTDYAHKHDLLRNQLSMIIHEAAQMEPAPGYPGPPINAAARITNLFLTLLDAQFPVVQSLPEPLLKNAQDYADRLAVHVNSLNRAVKEVTGRPTTAHIAERLVREAKLLLHHTDWSVSDIADRLGFGYPNYFTNFFKKQTGNTPLAFRRAV